MSVRAAPLLLIVSLAVAGAVGPRPLSAQPSSSRQEDVARSDLERELDRHVPEIVKAMRAAGRPLPTTRVEANALPGKDVGRGYERLDDLTLAELVSMRAALAEMSDEAFCATMWTGRRTLAFAPGLVLYLSEERQRRWAQIAVAAQLAEIRGQPPRRRPPAAPETQAALGRLFKALAADDARFLLAAMRARGRLTVPDRCRAAQLFYHGLNTVGPNDALVLFRASLYE
jgi:hypothetical protein